MCEERKLKRILFSVLIAVSWIVIAIHADKVMAATSAGDVTIQKNVSERLPTGQNGENTTVGPYAYLRPNSNIGNNVKIGANSVVLKNIPDNETVVRSTTEI